MALWKETTPARRESALLSPDPIAHRDEASHAASTGWDAPRRVEAKESVIGAQLAIEGKIEGAGHVRIAGRFTGDVHVDGNLTIEPGATVTGGVRAKSVVIGGQLDGNVVEAASVELLATGVLNGDLRAGTLTVAAGSRMRGHVEFGWREGDEHLAGGAEGNGSTL